MWLLSAHFTPHDLNPRIKKKCEESSRSMCELHSFFFFFLLFLFLSQKSSYITLTFTFRLYYTATSLKCYIIWNQYNTFADGKRWAAATVIVRRARPILQKAELVGTKRRKSRSLLLNAALAEVPAEWRNYSMCCEGNACGELTVLCIMRSPPHLCVECAGWSTYITQLKYTPVTCNVQPCR